MSSCNNSTQSAFFTEVNGSNISIECFEASHDWEEAVRVYNRYWRRGSGGEILTVEKTVALITQTLANSGDTKFNLQIFSRGLTLSEKGLGSAFGYSILYKIEDHLFNFLKSSAHRFSGLEYSEPNYPKWAAKYGRLNTEVVLSYEMMTDRYCHLPIMKSYLDLSRTCLVKFAYHP